MYNVYVQNYSSLEAKLRSKTIHELRQIARQIGVAQPSEGKKDRILKEILSIAVGDSDPAERNFKGARPKSFEYDARLVEEILEFRQIYIDERKKADESAVFSVSSNDAPEEYGVCGLLGEVDGNRVLYVPGKGGFLAYVHINTNTVKKYNLRRGDMVCGLAKRRSPQEFAGIISVESVNGVPPEEGAVRKNFDDFSPVYPEKRLKLSRDGSAVGAMLDMLAPVGVGQRTLVAVPNGVDRTEVLKEIAVGAAQNENSKVICLLTDARPEDCAEYERALAGQEVIASPFDLGTERSARIAELALEYAKRQAEQGRDAVLIIDNLTAYVRALNVSAAEDCGQLKISTLDGVKKFISFARNTENSGTLTIIAAINYGGNAFEEAVYNNLKDAFNSLIVLSAKLARLHVNPPVDICASVNAGDFRLLTKRELETAEILRTEYADNPQELFRLFSDNTAEQLCARFKK